MSFSRISPFPLSKHTIPDLLPPCISLCWIKGSAFERMSIPDNKNEKYMSLEAVIEYSMKISVQLFYVCWIT